MKKPKSHLLIVRCLNLDNRNSYLPLSKDILEGTKQNTELALQVTIKRMLFFTVASMFHSLYLE